MKLKRFMNTFSIMGHVFNTDYPVLWQLKHSWRLLPVPAQSLFLK